MHSRTEEDHEEEYVRDYRRFLNFVHHLRSLRENKQKIPKELLVRQFIEDVKTMRPLKDEEKEIFKDEETTRYILFHPMLHIVTTAEELRFLRSIEDLDNKKKHTQGTNSISAKGSIEYTQGTKSII